MSDAQAKACPASGAAKTFDARALTEQLAKMPDVVARLRAAHLPDRGSGLHCAICRVGGQGGTQRWPCRLRSFADAAQELIDIRASGPADGEALT